MTTTTEAVTHVIGGDGARGARTMAPTQTSAKDGALTPCSLKTVDGHRLSTVVGGALAP